VLHAITAEILSDEKLWFKKMGRVYFSEPAVLCCLHKSYMVMKLS